MKKTIVALLLLTIHVNTFSQIVKNIKTEIGKNALLKIENIPSEVFIASVNLSDKSRNDTILFLAGKTEEIKGIISSVILSNIRQLIDENTTFKSALFSFYFFAMEGPTGDSYLMHTCIKNIDKLYSLIADKSVMIVPPEYIISTPLKR